MLVGYSWTVVGRAFWVGYLIGPIFPIFHRCSCDGVNKLEDLQQLVSNPTSILSDILELVSAKARGIDKNAPPSVMCSSQLGAAGGSGDLDSPTVSTSHTNGAAAGVTHLGVVGRGVKRVVMSSGTAESSPKKKPAFDPTLDKDDGKAS